eukprot:m.360675 g.360675  ORF g.360675 m.360675 type:complete len:899 (-) comp19145_c0_seq1:271-2967(-)
MASSKVPADWGRLVRMLKAGDEHGVENLIATNRDVLFYADPNGGFTAMHSAAVYGRVNMVRLLHDKGADVDAMSHTGSTPLREAAFRGFVEVVQELHRRGASISHTDEMGWTPLHIAAQEGHLRLVEFLCEKAPRIVDINAVSTTNKTPLHLAAKRGHHKVVEHLLKQPSIRPNIQDEKTGDTALHLAVRVNDAHAALQCTEHFVNQQSGERGSSLVEVNERNAAGKTPLYIASTICRPMVVKLLLEKGANASIPEHGPNRGPNHGGERLFPLHCAAESGCVDSVIALVSASEMIDPVTCKQYTPLHLAAKQGYLNIIRELIQRGANPLLRAKQDQTTLHLAVRRVDNPEIVDELVAAGVDLDLVTTEGKTAEDFARERNHKDACKRLVALKNDQAAVTKLRLGYPRRQVQLRLDADRAVAVSTEQRSALADQIKALKAQLAEKEEQLRALSARSTGVSAWTTPATNAPAARLAASSHILSSPSPTFQQLDVRTSPAVGEVDDTLPDFANIEEVPSLHPIHPTIDDSAAWVPPFATAAPTVDEFSQSLSLDGDDGEEQYGEGEEQYDDSNVTFLTSPQLCVPFQDDAVQQTLQGAQAYTTSTTTHQVPVSVPAVFRTKDTHPATPATLPPLNHASSESSLSMSSIESAPGSLTHSQQSIQGPLVQPTTTRTPIMMDGVVGDVPTSDSDVNATTDTEATASSSGKPTAVAMNADALSAAVTQIATDVMPSLSPSTEQAASPSLQDSDLGGKSEGLGGPSFEQADVEGSVNWQDEGARTIGQVVNEVQQAGAAQDSDVQQVPVEPSQATLDDQAQPADNPSYPDAAMAVEQPTELSSSQSAQNKAQTQVDAISPPFSDKELQAHARLLPDVPNGVPATFPQAFAATQPVATHVQKAVPST